MSSHEKPGHHLFRINEALHLHSSVSDLLQFCFWLSASSVCLYVPQKCCGADRCIDVLNATQQAIYIDYNNTCGNPATSCNGTLKSCSYNATTEMCEVDPPPAPSEYTHYSTRVFDTGARTLQ